MNDQGGGLAIPQRVARGQWTAEERGRIVAASLVAGASINEVAKRYGVRANLLSAWRRREADATRAVQSKQSAAHFASVRLNTTPMDGTIEIDLSSHCIRVRGIVDAAMLREVLAAAR